MIIRVGKAPTVQTGFEPHLAIVLPHWLTSQGPGPVGRSTFHRFLFPIQPSVPEPSAAGPSRRSGSVAQMLARISALCGLQVGSAPREGTSCRCSHTRTPFSCFHGEESCVQPQCEPVLSSAIPSILPDPTVGRDTLQTRSCVIPHSTRRPPEAPKSSAPGLPAQRPTEALTSLSSQRIPAGSRLHFALCLFPTTGSFPYNLKKQTSCVHVFDSCFSPNGPVGCCEFWYLSLLF